MVVLIFPDELQEEVFKLVDPPEEEGSIQLHIKIKKEVSDENLKLLETLGVKIIKPLK